MRALVPNGKRAGHISNSFFGLAIQYPRYLVLTPSELYAISRIRAIGGEMSFYVFDLDGTIADCQHRIPLIDGTDAGYRAFFGACHADEPIQHVIDLMRDLIAAGHNVEIWSGRSDECEAMTQAWIAAQGLDPLLLTFMRHAGDKRPDDVVKRQMLRRAAKLGKRPDIVFDDRARVVAMWRAEGVPCFQVAPGDF